MYRLRHVPLDVAETYASSGGKSAVAGATVVARELAGALRAVVACPTALDPRSRRRAPVAGADAAARATAFPTPVDAARLPHVAHLGFHSPKSFGATPYLVRRRDRKRRKWLNVMVDSPRFDSRLADRIDDLGGVRWILLTHMDDVADRELWAERFPAAERVMHAADVRGADAWPHVEMRAVEDSSTEKANLRSRAARDGRAHARALARLALLASTVARPAAEARRHAATTSRGSSGSAVPRRRRAARARGASGCRPTRSGQNRRGATSTGSSPGTGGARGSRARTTDAAPSPCAPTSSRQARARVDFASRDTALARRERRACTQHPVPRPAGAAPRRARGAPMSRRARARSREVVVQGSASRDRARGTRAR